MFSNLILINTWCFTKAKCNFAEQFWVGISGFLNSILYCVTWPSLGHIFSPPLISDLQGEGGHMHVLSNNTKIWLFLRAVLYVPITPVPVSLLGLSSGAWSLYVNCFPPETMGNTPSHSPPHMRTSHSLLYSQHFRHFLAYGSPLIKRLESGTGMQGYIYSRQVNDQKGIKT